MTIVISDMRVSFPWRRKPNFSLALATAPAHSRAPEAIAVVGPIEVITVSFRAQKLDDDPRSTPIGGIVIAPIGT
ncbi:hypothetical protein [Hydrocarboniphaga sp.]|uniref:hypothetical protein n=1 Tax=Hydrocarboniphaga sp. TaxID=2033016 RepID=UPI002626107D|nr:hypothetical protein [Hydrocarboniphaga sp.]